MNRIPGAAAALLLAVGAALAAACAGPGSPAPPASTARPSPAVPLPYAGAPKVDRPLPPSVLSGDPCREALTAAQLKDILGATDPPRSEDVPATGPACRWDHPDSGAGLNVFYDIRTHQGLSAVYRNSKPLMTTWRPIPSVHGFPAVAFAAYTGIGADDSCDVSMGIADDYTVDAALNLGASKAGKADACELTVKVADMVIANLSRKAGR
ncbi:DUF3558 domain-containing protein [Amycolatopsis sp. NPDC004079]|uniref:DUF3558 domain-containing protein n=1 Tax=Amycolatopsis sp. NPDC004079 TaxID=3154549 RepID=UPI0033AAD9A3